MNKEQLKSLIKERPQIITKKESDRARFIKDQRNAALPDYLNTKPKPGKVYQKYVFSFKTNPKHSAITFSTVASSNKEALLHIQEWFNISILDLTNFEVLSVSQKDYYENFRVNKTLAFLDGRKKSLTYKELELLTREEKVNKEKKYVQQYKLMKEVSES